LFHAFPVARIALNDPEYGVFQGVGEGLPEKQFEFWGCFGCTGLYRKRAAD
jgi:hypothetical protein